MYEALYFGTKELSTRSKIGHNPIFLVVIEYNQEHDKFFIGGLDNLISIEKKSRIRSLTEARLSLADLNAQIQANSKKIEKVKLLKNGEWKEFVKKEEIEGITLG